MATLNLGKLYKNGVRVQFASEEIFDKATKQFLSQFISGTNTAIAGLEAAIAGKSPVKVVDDIDARDALTGLNTGDLVWVKDATDDSTVSKGAACYLASAGDSGVTWTKVAEAESMDLVIDWADIQNKPSSTVAAIDQAVVDSHTHANASVLDSLSINEETGNLKANNVELGKFTGIASGVSLDAATDYSDRLQIVVEPYDTEA